MADGPTRLRDLLDPVGQRLGLSGAVEAGRVFDRWSDIVGPDIATHVRPTSLRRGVLKVTAASPTWATEISYLAEELMGRINRAIGSGVVTELKVAQGGFEAPGGARRGASRRSDKVHREARESDPIKAFEKARAAWLARDRKSRSDQGF